MKIRYVPLQMLFLMAVAYGPSPLPKVAQTEILNPVSDCLEPKIRTLA